MGYFPLMLYSRVIIYEHKMFIRLATDVTNACGPSPQPTACRSPTCSLTTAPVVNVIKLFFGGNLDNRDFHLRLNSKNRPF